MIGRIIDKWYKVKCAYFFKGKREAIRELLCLEK